MQESRLSQQQDMGRDTAGYPLITASVTLIAYLVHTESPGTPKAFCVPLHCSLGASLYSYSVLLTKRTRELNTHFSCPLDWCTPISTTTALVYLSSTAQIMYQQ